MVLIAGAVLAAIVQLRFGAGNPGGFTVIGVGAAVVSPSPSTRVPPGQSDRFTISGSVTGLYPGATLPLVLTISNQEAFPISVTSVSTSVGSPSAGCAASNLTVTQFAGSLTVPAKGTATLTLMASLSHDTPDACQGVVFPLQYSGMAVKA